MGRRYGSSKPTPTPLNGLAMKPGTMKRKEGNADTIIKQTTVENLPRTASKAWGGRDEEKRNEGELRRYDKGNQRQNPPTARHRGEGRDERRNQTKL